MQSRNSTAKYLSKKNERLCPHKVLYTDVHRSTTHKSQNETVQITINNMNAKTIGGIAIQWNAI